MNDGPRRVADGRLRTAKNFGGRRKGCAFRRNRTAHRWSSGAGRVSFEPPLRSGRTRLAERLLLGADDERRKRRWRAGRHARRRRAEDGPKRHRQASDARAERGGASVLRRLPSGAGVATSSAATASVSEIVLVRMSRSCPTSARAPQAPRVAPQRSARPVPGPTRGRTVMPCAKLRKSCRVDGLETSRRGHRRSHQAISVAPRISYASQRPNR